MKKSFLSIPRLLSLMLSSLCLLSLSNCRKFIEVEAPYTSISSGNVYLNDATAIAVLTNIFAQMSSDGQDFTNPNMVTNVVFPTGLNSDELTIFNAGFNPFQTACYSNSLSAVIGERTPGYWSGYYQYIFRVNSAIEGLSNNTVLSASVQKQLLGEAKFLRAYYYFHLVNLYGSVPLALTTDFKVNNTLQRSAVEQVYEQIITDLQEAQGLLSDDFKAADMTSGTTERVRPTKWAATALLARVYLYTAKYQLAIDASTKIIEKTGLFGLDDLDKVFLKNSKESIWQLQLVNSASTGEGFTFKLSDLGPDVTSLGQNVYLSDYIYNAFESGDLRKNTWIGTVKPASGITYHFPYKYKIGREVSGFNLTEYLVMFRLAEQFLIRAEARTYLNDLNGAKDDLYAIRHRAGLLNSIPASTKDEMLSTILHERRVELFTEGGHRWFDLKRWPNNTLSTVMTPVCQAKGGTWNNNWALYPIPFTDIESNMNLQQNQGY